MHYIIQENLFKEQHYDLLSQSLKHLNLPFTTVRIFPFVNKIVDLNDIKENDYNVDDLPEIQLPTKNVFVFGSIKLARIASNKNWIPGSLMNSNHDFLVYSKYYKENLLNYDSIILKLGSDLKWKKGELKFIRPTKDNKAFTGKVFDQNNWEEMIDNYLHNYKTSEFNENTEIQVSSPKNIKKEIRFWVVDGKVITASQYKLGATVLYDDVFEDEARNYAQSMVDIFQLADAFVIDVCLSDDGWKIVECNCINCAGFYKSDVQKIIMAVDHKFNQTL